MSFNPTTGSVHNEQCDIQYWYQGQGPLIIFIPGGNGHGRQFNNIIAALSGSFTCATFDRRQMSSSRVAVNKRMSPPQQARDVRAVITALGFEKAVVFGSSSGGIFAIQFAHDFPDMVDHCIAHEAPLTILLPDASELTDWYTHLIHVHRTQGMGQAAKEFEAMLVGYDDETVPKVQSPEPENKINFWENEIEPLNGYAPNLWRIKENRVSIGVMRGNKSKDAPYARAVDEQAKVLNCPRIMVPGAHQGFENETEAFVPVFLDFLRILEERRAVSTG